LTVAKNYRVKILHPAEEVITPISDETGNPLLILYGGIYYAEDLDSYSSIGLVSHLIQEKYFLLFQLVMISSVIHNADNPGSLISFLFIKRLSVI
jgi:hypothetical protein